MATESTVVSTDRIQRITQVRTAASDEWRATVVLSGEFDVANAPDVAAELRQHLAAGRRLIRVDARAVEFMDSTAIGVLVTASEQCRGQRGSLILVGVPRRLRRVLTLAGLDQVLLVDGASDSDN